MRRSIQSDRVDGFVGAEEQRVESLGEPTHPAPIPHRELFVEEPRGELWQAVLSATGQPPHWF